MLLRINNTYYVLSNLTNKPQLYYISLESEKMEIVKINIIKNIKLLNYCSCELTNI